MKPFGKDFTEVIKFTHVFDGSGDGWFPIVEVSLVKPTGERIPLKLLFDTGATQITLRADYEFLFTDFEEESFQTAQGEVKGKIAKNQIIEFLAGCGKTLNSHEFSLF